MPRAGLSFEKAVATVQDLMDPDSTVTHDKRMEDRHGHKRQFDVVVHAKAGGHEILGVIECKDWKRPVGTPAVEQFITKSRDVRANFAIIISRNGFYQPELERAEHAGMGTMSLLPDEDSERSRLSVGVTWYAEVYRWTKAKLTVHYVAKDPPDIEFSAGQVTRKGKRAIDWFLKELSTTYVREEEQGWHSIKLEFSKKRLFEIAGQRRYLHGITFSARRELEKKKKWVSINGDALYDWQKGQIKIPPKTAIHSDSFRTDLSDWENHEGAIPAPAGIMDIRWTFYRLWVDPEKDALDLMAL